MRNLRSSVPQTRANVQATRDHPQCVRLFLDLVSSIHTAHLRSSIKTHTISLRSHHKDVQVCCGSKVADPAHRFIRHIAKRICGAVTGSIARITFDPVKRPGTSNLLTILSACTGSTPAVLARRYKGSNHGVLKKDVAEAVDEMLRRPSTEFARLREDRAFLLGVTREGAKKAREYSDRTMKEVRRRVGLRIPIE